MYRERNKLLGAAVFNVSTGSSLIDAALSDDDNVSMGSIFTTGPLNPATGGLLFFNLLSPDFSRLEAVVDDLELPPVTLARFRPTAFVETGGGIDVDTDPVDKILALPVASEPD